MSTNSVEVTFTFGEEQQRTIDISQKIDHQNLAEGLSVNIISPQDITAQVKGVASEIEKIDLANIKAYIDLAGLGAGEHEVEVHIDHSNPLLTFVPSSKLRIRIYEE